MSDDSRMIAPRSSLCIWCGVDCSPALNLDHAPTCHDCRTVTQIVNYGDWVHDHVCRAPAEPRRVDPSEAIMPLDQTRPELPPRVARWHRIVAWCDRRLARFRQGPAPIERCDVHPDRTPTWYRPDWQGYGCDECEADYAGSEHGWQPIKRARR